MDMSFVCLDPHSSRNHVYEIINDENKFPKSFPKEMEETIEICEISIKCIEEIITQNNDDKDLIDIIKRKLLNYIYNNPYFPISELFFKFYKQVVGSYPIEPNISKFISPAYIPSIRELGRSLGNNEEPNFFMIPTDMKMDKLNTLLNDIFHFNFGKFPNLEKILLWFPDYLQRFYNTYNSLMYDDGPLPIHLRFYIAIMAAASHNSDYLINRLALHFIRSGGDVVWLQKGTKVIPQKLRNLSEIIKIMGYTPWKIKSSTFFKNNVIGPHHWSKNELIQAFLIISFHQSLACFCIANGIVHEVDDCIFNKVCETEEPVFYPFEKKKIKHQKSDIVLEVLKEISSKPQEIEEERLKKKMDSVFNDQPINTSDDEAHTAHTFKTQNRKSAKKNLNKSEEIREENISTITITYNQNCKKYLDQTEPVFIDNFDWHKYKGLKSYECNWESNIFFYIYELYPDIAQNINDKFSFIKSMTDKVFSSESVNTEPFRLAIWNYSENSFGFIESDYDYGNINKLIPRAFKSFIKNCISNPSLINLSTFHDIPFDFKPYEYTQASLLAIEAKNEITLIYAIQALQQSF